MIYVLDDFAYSSVELSLAWYLCKVFKMLTVMPLYYAINIITFFLLSSCI